MARADLPQATAGRRRKAVGRIRRRAIVGRIDVLVLVLVAAGCSSGARPGASPSTITARSTAPAAPTTRPPTTSPQAAARAAVLAAYRAFWADVVAASATSDSDSPRLARHATGVELAALRTRLADDKRAGRVARGAPRLLKTTLAALDGKKATVRDCMDSNHWLFYDAKSGALRDKPSGKLYAVTAGLVLDHDAWKVATLDIQEARCGG
jgi:hypothetical protein